MWDLPRPGLEPVSPALAGGLPTTAQPGKPYYVLFLKILNLAYNIQSSYTSTAQQSHVASGL